MKVTNPVFTKIFFSLAILSLAFSSCIRKEAANKEADILKVEVEGVKLLRDPQITNNEVTMHAQAGEKVTSVILRFTLSKGATISPESGKPQDFTKPVIYTVTAEDKKTEKKYAISILQAPKKEDKSYTFSFENIRLQEGMFQVFQIPTEVGVLSKEWATSNLGYALSGQAKKPEDFPVSQCNDGYKGKCAQLTTRDTGEAGKMFNAPIAAGSLFLGELDPGLIAVTPLKATKFGIPFQEIPTKLAGYYKYTAGAKYQEGSKFVEGKKDHFDLYAVLYEVSKETPNLDGSNSLNSKSIVLLARLENTKETGEWTAFEIPFKPMNGKQVDPKKLKEGGYNFSIIASSSLGAAKYMGAVGSTLLLDELQVFIKE